MWVTPLQARVKKESVRKLFYESHCGVVLNVAIQDHKNKMSNAKAHYAFGTRTASIEGTFVGR